ncbi:MAG TPA: hypothetical protein VF240_09220 [Pyrinomonadaceae bacterium]
MLSPAPEINSLPPFALVLSLEYRPEDAGQVLQLGQQLAASHAEHPRGYRFAAYTEDAGPVQKIHVLAPLQSPHETEERRNVLADTQAQEALANLYEHLKNSESFIATYIPELSNPFTGGQSGPVPYVYLISAMIKPGLTEEARASAREAGRKIVAAHQQSVKGRNFVTYHSYSGTDDVFHVAVLFAGLGELDEWVENHELLREAYGAEEAARLLDAVGRVSVKYVGRVAKYHPFISNIT